MYLRFVALDYRNEWIDVFNKASEYLRVQCNNDSGLEDEVLECARKFIFERYHVDKESVEADSSFDLVLKNKKFITQKYDFSLDGEFICKYLLN